MTTITSAAIGATAAGASIYQVAKELKYISFSLF